MRQRHAVGEGCAALVVDQQKGDPIGAVSSRHTQHPRLQELAFAAPGGSADQRVWALLAQVEVEVVTAGRANQGAQGCGPPRRRCDLALARRDGFVGDPLPADDRRIGGNPGPGDTQV